MHGTKYLHTNIIARNWQKLSKFYQDIFEMIPVPPKRDLSGEWLDQLTGIPNVKIEGEHLALPGYEKDGPTLEIFSYVPEKTSQPHAVNQFGLGHIAFLVEDIAQIAEKIVAYGGSAVGKIVSKEYPNNMGTATFIYMRDPEGNIIELQSWKK